MATVAMFPSKREEEEREREDLVFPELIKRVDV